MAIIKEYKGKLPKRIDDYVIYDLDGQSILKLKSGFTTEELLHAPTYEKCRQNASEYGKVSSLCKQLRLALQGVLPKKDNLLVVNTLAKRMYEVMTCDTTSARGSRNLATALTTAQGRERLTGFSFNPDSSLVMPYELQASRLTVSTKNISFAEGSNCVGFRVHRLGFDFTDGVSQLDSTDWLFHGNTSLPETVVLDYPLNTPQKGVVFTILEVQFYSYEEGSYVPMGDDRSKQVLVVGVLPAALTADSSTWSAGDLAFGEAVTCIGFTNELFGLDCIRGAFLLRSRYRGDSLPET